MGTCVVPVEGGGLRADVLSSLLGRSGLLTRAARLEGTAQPGA